MNLICHRGCRDRRPENTVAAVTNLPACVDMVEIDVQRCGTGELVVFHDRTLDALTGGSGAVAATPWDELRTYAVGGSEEHVPLFGDLLEAVPDDVGVHVELKHAGMTEAVLESARGADNDLVFSSFTPQAIGEMQAHGYATAHLVHPALTDDWETELAAADSLGCEYVHPYYELVDADRVAAAHDRGLGVNAWTAPDRETVGELRTAGVDGVMVDDWCVADGGRFE